jgi:putative ABC transport system permease protein
MFKNYLKIAFRNIKRNKSFALINIIGLALGLTCCIIITKFVISEVGYDTYHKNVDRLYRVSIESELLKSGKSWKGAMSPILWGPALVKEYPEIESYTRLMKSWEPLTFDINGNRLQQNNIYFAENSLFNLFNWDLISGEASSVFNNPYNIVLTNRIAHSYFGSKNPIGKTVTLILENRDEHGRMIESKVQMTVTGVMADVYPKTHVKPEVLVSFVTLNDFYDGDVNSGSHPDLNFWRRTNTYTYLLLRESCNPRDIEEKFEHFMDKYIGEANISRGFQYHPYLKKVSAIHLEKDIFSTPEPGGNKDYIYLFSIISLFILLIACFNFMNMSTACAGNRSKEVGIRKAMGSNRSELIVQFLGESVLISMIAFVLAFVLSEIISPIFSYYIGKDILVLPQEIPLYLLGIVVISLITGIFAGSYPAFILSSFKPVLVLKKTFEPGRKGNAIRKALVILQFVITIVFIITTIIVKNQISFMKTTDLGFKSSHIFVIPATQNSPLPSQLGSFRNEALLNHNIKYVSLSTEVPGNLYREDIWKEYQTDKGITALYEIETDYDFIDAYNLSLIAGRNFSQEMATDAGSYLSKETKTLTSVGISSVKEGGTEGQTIPKEIAVILNEEAVQRMGLGSPDQALGKVLVRDPVSVDFTGRVIGVVSDFHFASMQYEIEPLVIYLHDKSDSYPFDVSVHVSGHDIEGTIVFIEQLWNSKFPNSPFTYFFVDDKFAQLYEQNERTLEIFGYLTLFAIFIACLGLYGLVSFIVEQRTKELGIRKVLGASVFGILALFSEKFIKWVLIANFLAWPISWYVMNKWLQGFAYKTDIEWWIFLLSGCISLVIAIITVSSQVIKAALTNPVESLRYE